jgi:hypothetical protein
MTAGRQGDRSARRRAPDPPRPGRAPDAIEPFVGYKVLFADGAGALRSMADRSSWTTGWNRARCLRGNHDAPLEGCTCGLYASKELESSETLAWGARLARKRPGWPDGLDVVIVKVSLAGKVIEHDRGYRAELARVDEVLRPGSVDALEEYIAITDAAGGASRARAELVRIAEVLRERTNPALEDAVAARYRVAVGADTTPLDERTLKRRVRDARRLGCGPALAGPRLRLVRGVYFLAWIVFFLTNWLMGALGDRHVDAAYWWLGAVVLASAIGTAVIMVRSVVAMRRSARGRRRRSAGPTAGEIARA